jgi:hypothetical protein
MSCVLLWSVVIECGVLTAQENLLWLSPQPVVLSRHHSDSLNKSPGPNNFFLRRRFSKLIEKSWNISPSLWAYAHPSLEMVRLVSQGGSAAEDVPFFAPRGSGRDAPESVRWATCSGRGELFPAPPSWNPIFLTSNTLTALQMLSFQKK